MCKYHFPSRNGQVKVSDLRSALHDHNISYSDIQELSDGTYSITLPDFESITEFQLHPSYKKVMGELYDNVVNLGDLGTVLENEVRIVDPVTGGAKGAKPLELSAIDPLARAELGRVASFGTKKYDRGNYLKGYNWSLSLDALHRHVLAFESGEDYDDESGILHMAHAAWHCLAICSFILRECGNDDRFGDS